MFIFIFIACFLSIILLHFWLIPVAPFPSPSGRWRVGTAEITWDSPSHIGILTKIWYPTNSSIGTNSPYIDHVDRTIAVLTDWLNLFLRLIFKRMITPAFINAPLVRIASAQEHRSPTEFPLILLSPALGAMNWLNTAYALEFASHGFVVIGINHPGSSGGTLLTNGSSVKFNNISKEVFEDIDRLDRRSPYSKHNTYRWF